jgi:hypothetical protein
VRRARGVVARAALTPCPYRRKTANVTTDLTFTPPARLDAPDYGAMLRWAAAVSARTDLADLVPVHERSWIPLPTAHNWDAWLIGWPSGSDTGWHDHQGSAGVMYVARGTLTEFSLPGGATSSDVRTRRIDATRGRNFGANHIHHVVNEYDEPAYSIHVYAPRLRGMTRYAWQHDLLVTTGSEPAGRW